MKSRLQRITNWPELAKISRFNVQALAEHCPLAMATLEPFFVHTCHAKPHVWLNSLRLLYSGASVSPHWPSED